MNNNIIIKICLILATTAYSFVTLFMLIQGIKGVIKRKCIFLQPAGRAGVSIKYYEGVKAIVAGVVSIIFGLLGLFVGYFIFFMSLK